MKKNTKDVKPAKVPGKKHSIFTYADGRLRMIWIWIIAAAAYLIWTYGFHFLWHAALHEGTDSVLFLAIEGAGLLAIAAALVRILHIHDHHGFYIGEGGKCLGIGIALEIIAVALCLALDSLRLYNPIGKPTFSWNQPILIIVILIEDLAAEKLLQNVLYCAARDRIHRIAAIALTAATAFVVGQSWTLPWIGMINMVLLSVSCCLLHDRWGLAASAGFGIGWAVASNVILSEYGTGIWNIYHVSEPWLTGNGTGVFNGIIATAMLVALIMMLVITEKKHTENAHCKTRPPV